MGRYSPGAVDREPPLLISGPHQQWASGPMTLVVRTSQDPAALAPAVRAEIKEMDPNLPISDRNTGQVHGSLGAHAPD